MSSSRLPTERADTLPADTAVGSGAPGSGPLVLERYRLERRLGAGAFGTVWMAHDERLERPVAIKILARQLIADGRFEREARAAARLAHPAIVTLYEAAVDDEGAYLVSEPVLGCTLDTLLAQGRLSDRDILAIGVALCDALEHAHSQGVVHRDVKPSNVLIPDKPGRGRGAQPAKLTDFGVARVIDADSLTLTGDVVGTLAYMAPEQAAGLEASEPADLYALALVLYEALTGVNPVRPRGRGDRQLRPMQLPALRRQRRELPASLGAAIDRALAVHVADRGTIAELRDGLADAGALVSDEPGVVEDPWTRRRDHEDGATEPLFWPRRAAARDPDAPARGDAPGRAAGGADAGGRPRTAIRRSDAQHARAMSGPDPSRLLWQRRALAAAGAAGAVAWLSHQLLAPAPAPPAVIALAAAGAVLALPRLGWLAAVAFLCVTAALQGHSGATVMIAVLAAIPMLAMPATATAWPLAAAAPALGLVGLAGAWPAVAAWATSPWRRAMLAVTGWLWLLLTAPIAGYRGRTLYLRNPPQIPVRRLWIDSPHAVAHHVLAVDLHAGLLPAGVVWAVAALLAPYLVARRSVVLDLLRVALWAAATAFGVAISVALAHRSDQLSGAPTAAAGALAAAVLALIGAYLPARLPARPARRHAGPTA